MRTRIHTIGLLVAVLVSLERTHAAAREGLVFLEAHQDDAGGVDGLDGAIHAAVSPDGTSVYIASWEDGAVAVFRRDPATGRVMQVQVVRDGAGGIDALANARGVAVSPDGTSVYACGHGDDAVSVFARDPATGLLSLVQTIRDGIDVEGLDGAHSAVVSPDGGHVYVTGSWENSVVVFQRDPSTGALGFIERQTNSASVTGLYQPEGIAISPDGTGVYVAGWAHSTVVAFQRDTITGRLAFAGIHQGPPGLLNTRSIVVSPDGRHVYAGSDGEPFVAMFARDPATSSLTRIGAVLYETPQPRVDETWSLAVSPDGDFVYASGPGSAQVEVFRRDAATGLLTFLDAQADVNGRNHIASWGPCVALAVSPDGRHVYLGGGEIGSGFVDNALTVFRHAVRCSPTPDASCRQTVEAGASRIQLRHGRTDDSDRLVWRWAGQATTLGGFGDPFLTSDYALCVYDDVGGTPRLVLEFGVPPHGGVGPRGWCGEQPCWKAIGSSTLRYVDPVRTPDGVFRYGMRAGADGKAKITMRGKGPELRLPALGLLAPVVVQLQSSDGDGRDCWEATYSGFVSVNDQGRFTANSD